MYIIYVLQKSYLWCLIIIVLSIVVIIIIIIIIIGHWN